MTQGPPFTVPRYGSLGASIIAERDWLKEGNANYAHEVERLKAAQSHMYGEGKRFEGLWRDAEQALQKYGFHTSECSAGFPISDHCTCGFSDVLRGASPQSAEQNLNTPK